MLGIITFSAPRQYAITLVLGERRCYVEVCPDGGITLTLRL
jgi:hypothetical protein